MIPNTDIEGAGFLYPLDLIATVLSLGGSIVLFCLCLRMQSTFMLSLKFILAISIADFFYSFANVLSNFQNSSTEGLCTVEAILRQCSFILSIFFSTCTAIASYKSAEPQSKFNRPRFFILSVTVGPIIFFSVSILG